MSKLQVVRLPAAPAVTSPAQLPLTALLLVQNAVKKPSADAPGPFNVPGVMNRLLGGAGWERLTRVVHPKVWAPHWSDEELLRFASGTIPGSTRSFPIAALSDLRERTFPPPPGIPDLNATGPTYDIVHMYGSEEFAAHTTDQVLRLFFRAGSVQDDDFAKLRVLGPGLLRDLLAWVRARLLILQVTADWASPDLARMLVSGGVPAVLIVSGGNQKTVDRYFAGLYANLIHNKTLTASSRPSSRRDAPKAELFLARGANRILQLNRWFDELSTSLDHLESTHQRLVGQAGLKRKPKLLHTAQVSSLKRLVYRQLLHPREAELVGEVSDLRAMRDNINWARETSGVLPLSQIADAAVRLERTLGTVHFPVFVQSEIDSAIREAALHAPRVLNANFSRADNRELVTRTQPLIAGRRYSLLVDVGPRWDRSTSLVTGNAEFPEEALPPDENGSIIRVVLFSDDFLAPKRRATRGTAKAAKSSQRKGPTLEPVQLPPLGGHETRDEQVRFGLPVAIADMWLPRGTGRSQPIVNGRVRKKSGPVKLSIVAPTLPAIKGKRSVVRGRLCLYYANNLIQSARVVAGVARGAGASGRRATNRVDVDYRLSGGFTNLEQFETRALHAQDEAGSYPVGLNVTLNDDGNGDHRIMIAGADDLTVSRRYDPKAAATMLDDARTKLKECFWLRDHNCMVTDADERRRTSSLGAGNAKALEQFRCDLYQLAWYGSNLYDEVFGQLSRPDLLTYLARVQRALSSRTVIQIARTSMAQYTYPWALIYDIPLPDRDRGGLNWCRVLDEWSHDAGRTLPPAKQCPYHDTAGHRRNVLCPYGFWGLKHYIEQPINVESSGSNVRREDGMPADALQIVKVPKPLALRIAVTRDAALDGEVIGTHLTRLSSLNPYVPEGGADTRDSVHEMLATADVAYFLCHGEYDPRAKSAYLGVGLRDMDPVHRIYPNGLFNWARSIPGFWSDRQPVVFINGCHTADLKPGEILSFVTTFANFGASAVIGTEVSIRLPLATEVAEGLLGRLMRGDSLGVAIHAARWELANKGNLLGLAYTPYGLSSLSLKATGDG